MDLTSGQLAKRIVSASSWRGSSIMNNLPVPSLLYQIIFQFKGETIRKEKIIINASIIE